jgi:two-component system, NtrC family, response regulator AtoC
MTTFVTPEIPAVPHSPVNPVSHSSLRILVVDDEELIGIALNRFLKAHGHKLVTTRDGQEALAMAHRESFDLVIADIRMPGMNGLEFYQCLLEIDRTYSRRFIFMTGDLTANDLISRVRENPCPCLEKPFHFSQILQLIPKEKALTGSWSHPGMPLARLMAIPVRNGDG